MGKYDDTMYDYLSDNARFADFFNGAAFHGEPILQPDMLEGDAERYATEQADSSISDLKMINRVRDIKKRARSGANFAIFAIENQASIDYIMPWRIMQYDQLEYGRQIKEICSHKENARKKRGKKSCKSRWRLGNRFVVS